MAGDMHLFILQVKANRRESSPASLYMDPQSGKAPTAVRQSECGLGRKEQL